VADAALRGVRLERQIELGSTRIRVLDWPGHAEPIVCVPDPFAPDDAMAAHIAAEFAPVHRVVSIQPRQDVAYQAQVDDLRRTLQQFGFLNTLLVSSGHGACLVLPLAAWYHGLVRAVVLIDPQYAAPASDSLSARTLRDCPPDWPALTRPQTFLAASLERALACIERVLG
jgi:pimeloyl-ACP methyl ester carboxylesterase